MTGTETEGFTDGAEAPDLGPLGDAGETWHAKFPGSRKVRGEGEAAHGPAAAALSAFAAELDREGALLARHGTIRASVFREAAEMARARAGAARTAPGGAEAVTEDTGSAQSRTDDPDGLWYDPASPEGKLFAAVDRMHRAEIAEPHADADAEAEYAAEQVALAARGLVRHIEAEQAWPAGWDAGPVHGRPREGDPGMREFTCGDCGADFGSNCRPADITCPECDARLCANCGHWEAAAVS